MGNPRLPDEIKRLRGTFRPERAEPKEDAEVIALSPADLPKPPAHLNEDGRAMWAKLARLLVRSQAWDEADAFSLEMVCHAWQRWREKAKNNKPIPAAEDQAVRLMLADFGVWGKRKADGSARPKTEARATPNAFAAHARR